MASQTPDWTWELKNDTQSQDVAVDVKEIDVLPTIPLVDSINNNNSSLLQFVMYR